MAKFTKLNIGDSVASSGGRAWKKLSSMLQLSAPTLSLDGDMLTITDGSKLATSFDILVGGEVKGTATSATFDLSTLDLEEGTYSITVIAKADGYLNSAESEAVSYTVSGDELVGTWLLNTSLSYASSTFGCDVTGTACFGSSAISSSLSRITVRGSNSACSLYGNPSSTYYSNFYDSTRNGTYVYTYSGGSNGSNVSKTSSKGILLRTFTIDSIDKSQANYDLLNSWLKANATKTA